MKRNAAARKQRVSYLEAQRQIARLESMRINVEAFQPIVKLGLMEVETSLKDFKRQPLGEETEETWYRKGYRDVYVGVHANATQGAAWDRPAKGPSVARPRRSS